MDSFATAADLLSAHVMAAVAAILLAGAGLARLAQRLGQPPVIGEIAAGIVLGPSLLGLLPGDPSSQLFPPGIKPMLGAVSQFGLLLFLFLIGWEFNKNLINSRRGTAGAVSASSVLVAFGLGAVLALGLYAGHDRLDGETINRTGFVLFIGAAMAVTAFPVLARILGDSGLMHTRVGALALASAAVDDVIAWCLLAFVSATVTASGQGDLLVILLLSVAYVALMLVVVRPLLARLVARLPGPSLLPVLAAGAFLSSYATTWIGIHAIFGAFLFGFVMPREIVDLTGARVVPLSTLREALEGVAAVMLPVFFIITGLGVDITALTARNYLELLAILVVACAGKFLGACVPARLSGMPWREVGVLGVLMNTRGLTELIILNAGAQLGVLDTQMFTMMVIMALFTTALAGPLLPVLLRRPLNQAAPDGSRPEAALGV
ncbi:cation:proton antiporter [Kineosporia sp. J2-2]|uniref:Cation:proton antiporter n=1 Tax=Kineosporia corallincola TaxID=2835133 RepID=A0ABS5TKS8_9ACTN|nr:cation:proton antiporter [Kineosporia corallincola]MBT0771705.1 cation:proton antiporter [Kineosporia corallincola]